MRNDRILMEKVGIPTDELSLHEAIGKGLPYSVFSNILSETDIQQNELIDSLAISPSALQQAENRNFTQCESDKLYRIVNILTIVIDYFNGDQKDALRWLRSNVKGLAYKRPIDLVSSSVGTQMVKDLIGKLEHGTFV
ncbi:antitoxin Xre/MbcA/ParS toxin-binding domain-containing protein [uncultured Alteromonas sp.]|uniref:type II RES/Xre toxin-antitoxin system antitoxin n=1 Tax=uncultured Alteromonas sp. TaxID=179113 RepID=UPI0030EC09F9